MKTNEAVERENEGNDQLRSGVDESERIASATCLRGISFKKAQTMKKYGNEESHVTKVLCHLSTETSNECGKIVNFNPITGQGGHENATRHVDGDNATRSGAGENHKQLESTLTEFTNTTSDVTHHNRLRRKQSRRENQVFNHKPETIPTKTTQGRIVLEVPNLR